MAALEEAGDTVPCPGCDSQLSVPGIKELAEWRSDQAAQHRHENKRKAEREARHTRKAEQVAAAIPVVTLQDSQIIGLVRAGRIAVWLRRYTAFFVVVYAAIAVAILVDVCSMLGFGNEPLGNKSLKELVLPLVYMALGVGATSCLLWLLLFVSSTVCGAMSVLSRAADSGYVE
jgi:hypothetical protein